MEHKLDAVRHRIAQYSNDGSNVHTPEQNRALLKIFQLVEPSNYTDREAYHAAVGTKDLILFKFKTPEVNTFAKTDFLFSFCPLHIFSYTTSVFWFSMTGLALYFLAAST